jgi:O-antigen ligase
MNMGERPLDAVQVVDSWPHTRRPLPWLLAGFLAAIFLVPIDAVHLKVHLPFNSDFDRAFVTLIVATWAIAAVLGNRRRRVVQLRPHGWAAGMIAFTFIAVASIVVNIDRITNLGEWDVAQKKLAVLIGLVAIFAIFSLTLRISELRSFSALIVVLAAIAAVGTIYEEKTGNNIFYSTATSVLSPVAIVDPAPTDVTTNPSAPGRPMIAGATRHPLSLTSILGMSLPFAVVLAAIAPSTRRRLLWILAACIIFTGALITQRRSGAVVPGFALLMLFILRPRQLLRLAPFGILALVLGLGLSGGGFSSIQQIKNGGDRDSTMGRTADYEAIIPDVLTNPMFGSGYGTHDSIRVDTYRIFDNEYLGQISQVGVLGLIAFLALILTPLFIVRSVLRSDHPLRGPPALAAGAACLAFGVAASLYDILSFPQAPYLFLFMAAVCTCAASVEVPAGEAARLSSESSPVPRRITGSTLPAHP